MAEDPIYMNDDDDVDPVTESLQVRSRQMFLPGEAGGWTPMPHSLVDRLVKSAASGVPDRSAAVEAHVRKNVGRRAKGSYRVGIIDGLTITFVTQILACDRSNARRILARVIQGLGGTRIGDGRFQFSSTPPPTPPPTPGKTPPRTPGKCEGERELAKVATPGCTPPSTPAKTPACTPGSGIKPAPTGHPESPQDYQDIQPIQKGQNEETSSVPPGEVEDSRLSDGMEGPAGPKDICLRQDVPEDRKDIPPMAGVPVKPRMAPDQDEAEIKVTTLFNNMCVHHDLPERQVNSIQQELEGKFRAKPLEVLIKGVWYMKANPGFKDLSWSIKTLLEKAEHYAQLWDEFYGPKAKAKTTASPAQIVPKNAGKTKTTQDIPDELRPVWERLQALQAQVELPDNKLHGNDWKVLVAEATPQVSAEVIAVRYEARISVCMAEGKEMQYWPSLRTFINNGDHLLPPAKVSASNKSKKPKGSLSRAEREIREQREAGGDTGWDSTTDSSNVLDDILGGKK